MPSERVIETPRDIEQLRWALRLCFDADRADRLAVLAGGTTNVNLVSLTPIFRAGRSLLIIERLLNPSGNRKAGQALLWPRRGSSPTAALMLALHLGMGLPADDLAVLTSRSSEQVGRDLMRAREACVSQRVRPCDAYASSIGRYRDPDIDRETTLALLSHLTQCTRCRVALQSARDFDAYALECLLDLQVERTLGSRKPGLVSLYARPGPLLGAIGALAVLLIMSGIAATGFVHRSAHTPVALLDNAATSELNSGWIIETTKTGEVDALNVATGTFRSLIAGQNSGTGMSLMSPDRGEIAQMTTSQPTGRPDQLRIFTLSGAHVTDWPLSDTESILLPLAWYDNSSIILCRMPADAFGASAEIQAQRADQQGSLILFDVRTGQRRTIFNHGARNIAPSPDGKYLAVSRYSTTPTRTIEIRNFDGTVVGPVLSTMNNFGLPFFWLPDSRRILFTLIEPVEITPVPRYLGDRGIAGQPAFSFAIATQDVDGHDQTLLSFPRGESGHVIGVSADGTHMIYLLQSNSSSGTDWAFWRRDLNGGESIRLASELPNVGGESTVWSPEGAAFITSAEPFYLPISATVPLMAGPTSYITAMISPDGHTFTGVMDQLQAPTLIGYVSGTSLLATSDNSSMALGSFGRPEVIPGLVGTLGLVEGSQVSPGGNQLLAFDRARNFYVSVQTRGQPFATVAGAGRDPAWLPDGSGIVSVDDSALSDSYRSRIALYRVGSGLTDGLLEFDPANLGSTMYQTYRAPQAAPDGLDYSFFVVDGRQVSLWIAGRSRSPRSIVMWTRPSNTGLGTSLVARWVDRSTLIVAVPEEWSDGYPQRVSLQRVTLEQNGTQKIESLLDWHIHGYDRGISVAGLAVSLDGSKLAVRLRHFAEAGASDTVDSIDVMRTADVASSVELVRGSSGSGMSWSPDGSDLAVTLGDRLAVTSWTGDELSYLSDGSHPVEMPVWVRPNEIWVDTGSSDAPTIRRVNR